MVDLKGIEPSNLTDANRALSQLSYRPIFNFHVSVLYQLALPTELQAHIKHAIDQSINCFADREARP